MSKATEPDRFAQAARRVEAARVHEQAGRAVEALREAWAALDLDSDGVEAKSLIARVLRNYPASAPAERGADLARMLVDPAVEPSIVARTAWYLLLAEGQPLAAFASDPKELSGGSKGGLAQCRALQTEDPLWGHPGYSPRMGSVIKALIYGGCNGSVYWACRGHSGSSGGEAESNGQAPCTRRS